MTSKRTPWLTAPIAVAAGVAMLAGCGSQDQAFQEALDKRDITVGAGPEDTRRFGLSICARHAADAPLPEIVNEVKNTTGLGPSATGYVIGAATAAYCDQYLPRLGAS